MSRPKAGYSVDGEPVPGTTTISGMLNKPALVAWAGKLCAEAAWRAGKAGEPLPRWNDVLYGTRDDAASAGTLCHDLAHAYVLGVELPAVPDTDVGRAGWTAFENFVHWIDASALTIEAHERPLVSTQFRYGGTPDALAHMSGKTYLVDYKTSSGVYAEMLLQMSAYRQLLHECEQMDVAGVHLVRFSRESGDFAHHYFGPDVLDLGWTIFAALLGVYAPLKQLEKRVR